MIEITVDFVNNIIKEYVGDDLGEYIVEEIKRIRQIDFECERYIEERRRLQREYNENIAEQNKFINICQEECKHEISVFYPVSDASGNNDSHCECKICGKWVWEGFPS